MLFSSGLVSTGPVAYPDLVWVLAVAGCFEHIPAYNLVQRLSKSSCERVATW